MKNITYAERQEIAFEVFCKKAIWEAASEIYRSRGLVDETEIPYDQVINLISSRYDPASWIEENCAYLYVRGDWYCIKNTQLANALLCLPPDKRAVIVISFFGRKTDYQIAQELSICPGTVAYRKKQGLVLLRNILGAEYGKQS